MRPLSLAVFVLATLAACNRQPPPEPSQDSRKAVEPAGDAAADHLLRIDPGMLRDLRMTTASVERRSAAADVDMLGEIGVNREAYAEVAPPIDAQVVRLLVPVDAQVREGQTLAELRSPEVGRARADVATAEARLQLAATTLERKRSLAAERIVAVRELQEAEGQMQAAQAALRAASTTLRALGVTAADTGSDDPAQFVLRAPIAGAVLERSAATGQFAQASQPMFRIANLSRVSLTVHAFERDAVQLVPKTSIRITLAALPGREFRGQVASIGRQVETSSRTVAVRIDLPNGEGVLRPGMSATAHVPIGAGGRALLALPAPAVQRVGENWVVFIPRGNGVFETRRIGRSRDFGVEVEVASGLDGGETVVMDGAFLLKAEAEKSAGGDEHGHEEK